MAPRHDNVMIPGTNHQYDKKFRTISPVSEASSQASEYRNCSVRDIDEKKNEDKLFSHQRKAWPHRLLYNLQSIFTSSLVSKNGLDLEPNSRRFYALASRIVVAAVAFAVYKGISGRQKWLFLSLFSRLSISGDGARSDGRDNKSNKLNKIDDMVQLVKSIYSMLISSLRKPDYAYAEQSSISLLRIAAQHGVVQRALIGATDIIFNTREGWKRVSLPPKNSELMSDMVELLTKGGCNEIMTIPDSFWDKAATPLLTALPFIYLAFAYRMLKGLQKGSLDDDGENFFSSKLLSNRTSDYNVTNEHKTSFSDVAGLDDILPEVREIVSYLRNPAGFHALGAESPRGILLHGSPGVGKTMIAKAIAGEADCDAFCVCSGSDFCEMYVGRGAGRIRTLFKEARKSALKKYNCRQGLGRTRWWPWSSTTKFGNTIDDKGETESYCHRSATAIIFIDELDAVAKSRSYGIANSNDERDQTLNQLLTEMDGFFQTNSGPSRKCNRGGDGNVTVIVIAATNRAEMLDPAILRRFDRQIHVPCPNKKGRMDILKVHAAKTRCRFSTIHWDYLAEETPNFSGSDLKQVVNDAALLAVRQQSKQIEQGHLLQSIQRARSMKVQNSSVGRGSGYSSSSMLPFVYRS